MLEAGKRYRPYDDYPTHATDFEVSAADVLLAKDVRRDRYTTPRSKSLLTTIG